MENCMEKEISFPKTFDQDMKWKSEMILQSEDEDLPEFVDNCIFHLKRILQQNQLVGKRNLITVLI